MCTICFRRMLLYRAVTCIVMCEVTTTTATTINQQQQDQRQKIMFIILEYLRKYPPSRSKDSDVTGGGWGRGEGGGRGVVKLLFAGGGSVGVRWCHGRIAENLTRASPPPPHPPGSTHAQILYTYTQSCPTKRHTNTPKRTRKYV
jgi:hypothetical protein